MLDPSKTFTVVREHRYTFATPAPPASVNKQSDLPAPDGADVPPADDVQRQLSSVAPCAGVISTTNYFVITGIDVSAERISPVPEAATGGAGELLGSALLEDTSAGTSIRRFEQMTPGHPTPAGFHDAIGIRMAGSSKLRIRTRFRGQAFKQLIGGDAVLTPAVFRVVTVVHGYCADELIAPPQNN